MLASNKSAPKYRRLAVQIVILLSIAVLPIGLISVVQTGRVAKETADLAELSLLTRTERAVSGERSQIAFARGAAGALAEFADYFRSDLEECEKKLYAFVAERQRYNYAALVDQSGQTICSSSGVLPLFSEDPSFSMMLEGNSPFLILDQGGPDGQVPVATVFHPRRKGGQVQDLIAVSLLHAPLEVGKAEHSDPDLIGIATFDLNGTLLSSTLGAETLATELPVNSTLSSFFTSEPLVVRQKNVVGDNRIFTVTPVIDQAIYALGIWQKAAGRDGSPWSISPIVFPLLMWLVSLLVAYLVMHWLVVRHVRTLGSRMRKFEQDRVLRDIVLSVDMPTELVEIHNDFTIMAHGILQDEAHLEDTLRTKNVLVKEVHHRVKNNLQMIASIMSMQSRKSENPEIRAAIDRLHQRVLSLATIHENVYQLQGIGRINAGRLVREVLRHSTQGSKTRDVLSSYRFNIEDLMLFPDQAVPLSLLVSEAVNNAFAYCETNQMGERCIDVELKSAGGTSCELFISNSAESGRKPAKGIGMGELLIRAFVSQLNGNLTIDDLEHSYALKVEFDIAESAPNASDY